MGRKFDSQSSCSNPARPSLVTGQLESNRPDRTDRSPGDLPVQRLNRPTVQPGIIAFTLLAGVLVAASVRVMLLTPIGSDPWQAGILGLALAAAGYVVVVMLLLWAQREVDVGPGTVTIRRWTDVLRGKDELLIPIDHLRVGVDGRVMLFAFPGRVYQLWIAYWPSQELEALREALIREGVTIED
jgi:hypothetical protein